MFILGDTGIFLSDDKVKVVTITLSTPLGLKRIRIINRVDPILIVRYLPLPTVTYTIIMFEVYVIVFKDNEVHPVIRMHFVIADVLIIFYKNKVSFYERAQHFENVEVVEEGC